eukprot:TRINITY_DN5348_c0_g1_i1.p1 TRINITY_DN5348_c0_g1~~TRINITY_DN5348_c0_g1_i1.p1  ORF type:complete len:396 (+),score=69.00 TRINITY_DN5348_c0_g1_i1:14-1201(+)
MCQFTFTMAYSWNTGPSWKDPTSYVGSLIRETAEERDMRLKRERMEREQKEAEALHERMQSEARLHSASAALSKDAIELDAMRQESDRLKQVIQQHEHRAQQLWQDSYVRDQLKDQEELAELTARNDQELEQARLASLRLANAEAQLRRDAVHTAQQLALHEQTNNPLGLYAASTPPMYGERPPREPSAPPAYGNGDLDKAGKQAKKGSVVVSIDEPPPYDAAAVKQSSELFHRHDPVAYETVEPKPGTRCASCFDVIQRDIAQGFAGRAVKKGIATVYHEECYIKKAAPHCAYCGWTLTNHPDNGLSGAWGEYKGKNYHVECYQYHAGPRCKSCFDVIFANPSKGYSGHWRSLAQGGLIHEECFAKCYTEQQDADRELDKAPPYACADGDDSKR